MFSRRDFILKPTERAYASLNLLGIFKKALHLRNRHICMWQSLEIWNVFNTFNLETSSLENVNLFGVSIFGWKYYDWKRNIPLKPTLSKGNVKTTKMGSAYGTHLKERSFTAIYLFFMFPFLREIFLKLQTFDLMHQFLTRS